MNDDSPTTRSGRLAMLVAVLVIVPALALFAGCGDDNGSPSYTGSDEETAAFDGSSDTATVAGDTYRSETDADAAKSYTEHARIRASFTPGVFSSSSAYVHFKAVDADTGDVIDEIPGSDEVTSDELKGSLEETSARRDLVDALIARLEADGWTEITAEEDPEWYSEDREWYETLFGR